MGTRKIYSYLIPAYPEGVNKEIDIRLKFTIKPDGTVGSIFLLTKADTRLENAAINSLWQWRFELINYKAGSGRSNCSYCVSLSIAVGSLCSRIYRRKILQS